jgi:hypothetical protein
MARVAPDTDVDEQLLQAINILKVCAAHTDDHGEEFNLTYPLWAAVALLEESDVVGHDSKIIEAETIVKAAAVTLMTTDQDIGVGGFEPSWSLNVAIDLIDEVIRGRPKKKRSRSKKAMREISTVDPDHARAFHRLLNAAGKLPVGELERLARYAEIELTNQKPRRVVPAKNDAAPASTEPPEARP